MSTTNKYKPTESINESEEVFLKDELRRSTRAMPLKAAHYSDAYCITKRLLRRVVARMREDGELVVGNPRLGYFMAANWKEYDLHVAPQMKGCFTYLKQYNMLKKKFTGSNDNQIEIELNLYDNKKKGVRMERKQFEYQKKENGLIEKRDVMVIRETPVNVEGIDMNALTEAEKRELEYANDVVKRLTKGNYKNFLKSRIVTT